ncbi:hypothetical protein CEXT_545961 [Caerostris extrusa]|uniref:Uncharacterized protein n=1 Tax=Caerostris extrusa TaxID=172846 RepID=A0AAV4Q458_CAEEX|nr:hypothetical protein CEXT_545961 [Caerostris extrusa]
MYTQTPGRFYSGDVVTQGYVLNQRSDMSGICPVPLKYSGTNRKIFSFFPSFEFRNLFHARKSANWGRERDSKKKEECGAINADR